MDCRFDRRTVGQEAAAAAAAAAEQTAEEEPVEIEKREVAVFVAEIRLPVDVGLRHYYYSAFS